MRRSSTNGDFRRITQKMIGRSSARKLGYGSGLPKRATSILMGNWCQERDFRRRYLAKVLCQSRSNSRQRKVSYSKLESLHSISDSFRNTSCNTTWIRYTDPNRETSISTSLWESTDISISRSYTTFGWWVGDLFSFELSLTTPICGRVDPILWH